VNTYPCFSKPVKNNFFQTGKTFCYGKVKLLPLFPASRIHRFVAHWQLLPWITSSLLSSSHHFKSYNYYLTSEKTLGDNHTKLFYGSKSFIVLAPGYFKVNLKWQMGGIFNCHQYWDLLWVTSFPSSGLYYKSFTIINYDHKVHFSLQHTLQS
jgi:hypothetical protein